MCWVAVSPDRPPGGGSYLFAGSASQRTGRENRPFSKIGGPVEGNAISSVHLFSNRVPEIQRHVDRRPLPHPIRPRHCCLPRGRRDGNGPIRLAFLFFASVVFTSSRFECSPPRVRDTDAADRNRIANSLDARRSARLLPSFRCRHQEVGQRQSEFRRHSPGKGLLLSQRRAQAKVSQEPDQVHARARW